MSASIYVYLAIAFAIGAAIIVVSIIAYNKRLDRITRGEERDTHSPIPEPKDTAGIIYKAALIGIVIISFLTVSALKGKIDSLQSSVNNLNAKLSSMSTELYSLRNDLRQQDQLVLSTDVNIRDLDLVSQKAEVQYTVTLKEYTEDTTVTLNASGIMVELDKLSPSTFGKTMQVDIFQDYEPSFVHITRGGTTVTEEVDFPAMLFYDCLPVPNISCRIESGIRLGKWTYNGEFLVLVDYKNNISSVTLSYLTSGKVLKTMDITRETLSDTTVNLEQGLALEHDLTARIEIVTKDGYTITSETILFYESPAGDLLEETPLTILDPNGRTVWQGEK